MSENQYLPIVGHEIEQLQFAHCLHHALDDNDSLKRRLDFAGVWWRYKGILKQLYGILGAAFATIEPEKRDRINYIWSRQELRVVNTAQAADATGDMLYIPKKAVVSICAHAQKESCAICMGNHQERKDCLFRRGLIDLALPDLRREEKKSGKCVGKLFGWGE